MDDRDPINQEYIDGLVAKLRDSLKEGFGEIVLGRVAVAALLQLIDGRMGEPSPEAPATGELRTERPAWLPPDYLALTLRGSNEAVYLERSRVGVVTSHGRNGEATIEVQGNTAPLHLVERVQELFLALGRSNR